MMMIIIPTDGGASIITVGRQGTAMAYLLEKKPRCKRVSMRASRTPVHRVDVN